MTVPVGVCFDMAECQSKVFKCTLTHCRLTNIWGFCVALAFADPPQLLEMGRAFSRLPVRVLWKLSKKDVPDQAALEALGLADNVKACSAS